MGSEDRIDIKMQDHRPSGISDEIIGLLDSLVMVVVSNLILTSNRIIHFFYLQAFQAYYSPAQVTAEQVTLYLGQPTLNCFVFKTRRV